VADFDSEVTKNVLLETSLEPVDHFFLVTNVPGSRDAVTKIDEKRRDFNRQRPQLYTDVLWQEHVIAWLDQFPAVWRAFPEIFPGGQAPILAEVAGTPSEELPRSLRLALAEQYRRDRVIRFKQITLEQPLSKLFVDLDVRASHFVQQVALPLSAFSTGVQVPPSDSGEVLIDSSGTQYEERISSLAFLSSEPRAHTRKIALAGGPGQGKSTITQMLAQLYREVLLQKGDVTERFGSLIRKVRFPIRIELRLFAEWLGGTDRSVEQYLAEVFSKDSGGRNITVDNIQDLVSRSPTLLILDGLDEIGSDELRNEVVLKSTECVRRFEEELKSDLRVIITSRPPAIAGRQEQLKGFTSAHLSTLNAGQVAEYVQRWTEVQCDEATEREIIAESFNKRKEEVHVEALAKNPMQLSVLLHFIRLKGEAFPDRRAELYREYFKTLIDRDVIKSPELLKNRDVIENLHEVIGFEIHSRAEGDQASYSLTRQGLLKVVENWLSVQTSHGGRAAELFKLGEERLGLIVVLKGEGTAARYGFEIQPVREYFAAAFINDKCEGNANEIFQAMILRPFWREVALFLAGLRRANEKADLLSRAKIVDDDRSEGWRQDGMGIVSQLLQERVLTTPRHVFRDSVSFLLQSLDPSDSRPRNERPEVGRILPKLVREINSPEHRRVLLTYLDAGRSSRDDHALTLLHSVTNKVFTVDEIRAHAATSSDASDDLCGRIRLTWPARDGVDLESLYSSERPMPLEPNPEWAFCLYRAGRIDNAARKFPETTAYHRLLLEQFAFSPPPFVPGPASVFNPDGASAHAVWALYESLLRCGAALQAPPVQDDGLIGPASSTDFSGLGQNIVGPLRDLIESAAAAAKSLREGTIGRAVRDFLAVIEGLVMADGLVGWVAVRCALSLLQYAEVPRYLFLQDGVLSHRSSSSLMDAFGRQKGWRRLRRMLPPFFGAIFPADSDRAGRTVAGKMAPMGLPRSVPSHLLVNGEFLSVPSMLLGTANFGTRVPFDWINRVPIEHYWVGGMLPDEPEEMESLLKWLACRRLTPPGPSIPQSMNRIQRIIAAARRSDSPAVSAGALFALLGTSFYKMASLQLTVKMIEADSHFANVSPHIFRNRPDRQSSRYLKEIVDLARTIVLDNPPISQGTKAAAANFLANHQPVSLPSLRSLESVADTLKTLATL
jgi:hypothetical protein